MSRVEGWESLLAAYIESARETPFRWGTHDCALWATEWVRLCTGHDFAADWRGRYATERGAVRLIRRRGYDGVQAIASAHLPEIPVPHAKRGDILQHPAGALGVCSGRLGHFPAPDGLTGIETLACGRAWGVG